MDPTEFQTWWKDLVAALKAGNLALPKYNATDLSGDNLKQEKADLSTLLPGIVRTLDQRQMPTWV
jgi:hypothetical protein